MSTLNVGTVKTDTIKTSADVEVYTCRAWVNFNGTGTVAIRASGNVSSITDNGAGDYTVNFTNAMADANFSAVSSTGIDISNTQTAAVGGRTSSSVRVFMYSSSDVLIDTNYIAVAIFR